MVPPRSITTLRIARTIGNKLTIKIPINTVLPDESAGQPVYVRSKPVMSSKVNKTTTAVIMLTFGVNGQKLCSLVFIYFALKCNINYSTGTVRRVQNPNCFLVDQSV